jgi:hypothetical protein
MKLGPNAWVAAANLCPCLRLIILFDGFLDAIQKNNFIIFGRGRSSTTDEAP